MEKATIISLIRDYLGFNTGLDEAVILRHMDIVQSRYEGGDTTVPLPWFLLDETATVSTVALQKTIDLPEGFIHFDEDWNLTGKDSEGIVWDICRVPHRDVSANIDSGRPNAYVLGTSVLYLYPTPDAVYTITLPHYARSEALSTATSSPWFTHFPRLVIAETILSIAAATKDEGLLRFASSMASAQNRNYLHAVEVMRNNQREIVMGSV